MAIDRIGKGTAPPEAPKTEAGRAAGTGKAFEVRAEQAAPARPAAEITPATSPLDQLRAGKIDVNGYVQMKLDEATAHLTGLRPADLESIRRALRDRIASDPTLAELAKTATGSSPSAPTDDE